MTFEDWFRDNLASLVFIIIGVILTTAAIGWFSIYQNPDRGWTDTYVCMELDLDTIEEVCGEENLDGSCNRTVASGQCIKRYMYQVRDDVWETMQNEQ